MGRDWLHWGGRRRRMSPEDGAAGGCMCSVFQIFDLHPFQLPLNHHLPAVNTPDLLHQEIHPSEGVEAPRNSLETEMNQPHNLNFPEGLQIKTRVLSTSSKTEEICSSTSTTTTPSLVARLMGLDILPQSTSPSSSRSHFRDRSLLKRRSSRSFSDDDINIGARSLPATPRLSLARKSDVEYHRRSLNSANKENANEEFETAGKRRGNYGKQIRRVGVDITNIRRDENLILNQACKKKHEGGDMIKKQKQVHVPNSGTKNARILTCPPNLQQQRKKSPKKVEAFVHHSATTNFTDSNSKKGPLSVKKAPSHPPTKLPQKQIQTSVNALASKRNTQLCNSKNTHSYKQPVIYAPDSNNRCGGAEAASEYRYYIQRILKRTGIVDGVTPLKLGKWHTPSHPLNPSIFYYIELFPPHASASAAVLSRRCNRKLVFQLVDELLAKILKPYLDLNPRGSAIGERFGLIDELCGKIVEFPGANCLVLEDIDGLIGKDLGNWGLGQWLEEEGGKLSREIEGEIMDWLVGETVETLVSSTASVRRRRNNRDRSGEVSRGIPRD